MGCFGDNSHVITSAAPPTSLLSPYERMVREKNVTEKSESYGCLAARSHKLTVAVAGY